MLRRAEPYLVVMAKDRMKQTSLPFAGPDNGPRPMAVRTKKRSKPSKRAVQILPQAVLPLSKPDDPVARERLRRRIEAHLDGDLDLVVTDNRCTLISVRRKAGRYQLRVHHMFFDAEAKVIKALARYTMGKDPDASILLNEYIEHHQDRIKKNPVRKANQPVLSAKGEVWDLQEIFDSLNRRFFDGALSIEITWGKKSRRRPKRHRSIKMGSYSVEDKLIRIHPALDRPFVPRYFIEMVVYHEMLHHIHPIPVINGKRRFHTPEFRAQERAFPHYARARAWERANIEKLLYY